MKNIFENIGIIFISTLTFFILIEIFSYSIFKFYYSLKIDDQRNPIQYSDETMYYKFQESKRVVALTESKKNQIYKVGERIKKGYSIMEENWINGKYSDLNLLWIPDLTIEQNQYIDYVHYSPAYNKKIGEEIFSALEMTLNDKQ